VPRYQDATGFLLELRHDINEGWFSRIIDLAIQLNGSAPSETDLLEIWSYLLKQNTYAPQAASILPNLNTTQGNISPVFLEKISNFNNFKKLTPSLNICFDKKITLVFGKNGSGKSSICQALKILASPEKPPGPLHNVRVQTPSTPPTFEYQFRGWQSPSQWNESMGFGSQSQFIKYFDSTVAISNSTENMRAENSVEISAFRLELFDFCRTIVAYFQKFCSKRIGQQKTTIDIEMQEIISRLSGLVNTQAEPFSIWSLESPSEFFNWLMLLSPFDHSKETEILTTENELTQLKSASTEQGQISIRAQIDVIRRINQSLIGLRGYCVASPLPELQEKELLLQQKNSAMIELAKDAFPKGINPTLHNDLIHSAAKLISYTETESCPLCLQNLDQRAKQTFRAYHQHLTSKIQAEVHTLNQYISQGINNQEKIRSFELMDMQIISSIVNPEFIMGLTSLVETIKISIPQKNQPQNQGNILSFNRYNELLHYISEFENIENKLNEALKIYQEGSAKHAAKIQELQHRLGSLRAHKALYGELQNLLRVCEKAKIYTQESYIFNKIDFSSIYRKLTNKGKEAHSDLVLGTFESKLNSEYTSMCGMNLSEFGIRLIPQGSDQDITIAPNIGNTPVHRVLSEGEQKVHALAIFMAEAMAHPHQMLIFDDPVTSFDYNYVSNFCERIRDLIRSQPDTQILILTHNWDFFVNLQTTLNRSSLNNSLSIQVLEDCATAAEYTEKWDELCREIEPIVNGLSEPSPQEKEHISGLMRRLIERLTNAYVFNEQRHQFKIKTLNISDFQSFTKIVPLTTNEANELRDLYSNLSPPEHDDVRNFYTTKTRLQFKNWYDRIVAIKNSVAQRRP